MSGIETCVICKDGKSNDPLVTVCSKGLRTLMRFSNVRENRNLEKELNGITTITVHATCQPDFTNKEEVLFRWKAVKINSKNFDQR